MIDLQLDYYPYTTCPLYYSPLTIIKYNFEKNKNNIMTENVQR